MFEWSVKRKLIYLGIVLGVVFIFATALLFFYFYEKPTCFDQIQNQREAGIDCGGSCEKLCEFQIIYPVISWSRVFEVANGVWSAVAYIENPNINAKTDLIQYLFKLRDSSGNIILEKKGETFIPNSRAIVIFEPNLRPQGAPTRADLEFLGEVIWKKDSVPIPDISVRSQRLTKLEETPRLEVSLENKSFTNIRRLEVVAVVFDGGANALGSSRTFVDDFNRGTLRNIVFTWPNPFPVQEKICQVPVDIALVVDRSGSMIFDNWDLAQPEPLTTAKEAALDFLEGVRSSLNRVSLVSFSTEAEIQSRLSGDNLAVQEELKTVAIKADTINKIWSQETNIAEGLELAFEELQREPRDSAERVVVLFTDGVPTHPKKQNQPNYPMSYTKSIAQNIKEHNITLFSIGLGQEQIDEELLRELSSSPEHYFQAPQASDLKRVFSAIAEEICREAPTTVDIITRPIP